MFPNAHSDTHKEGNLNLRIILYIIYLPYPRLLLLLLANSSSTIPYDSTGDDIMKSTFSSRLIHRNNLFTSPMILILLMNGSKEAYNS